MTAADSADGWGGWRSARCVGSGRQALALVARWCRAHAMTTALLPAYHCETMALPFWLEAMAVRAVPVDHQLRTDPRALARALAQEPSPVVILICRTGAIDVAPGLVEVLRRARAAGHLVVEDATHCLLDELVNPAPALPADIRMASLRKLLPVPEGAWIATSPDAAAAAGARHGAGIDLGPLPGRRTCHEQMTLGGARLLREQQLWAQREQLPERGGKGAPGATHALRLAIAAADEAFDAALAPAAPAPGTLAALASLDLLHWARRWRDANAQFCALLGPQLGALNPGRACFPLLRHQLASQIDEELGRRGAFAPQYWPRPSWFRADAGWPEDVLSIDIRPDQSCHRAAALADIVHAAVRGG
ncbi:hypothetical protein SAMN05443377_10712 [Propionibacterium cyclohexanicum]|uniref:dTDP-4-amino-4,6-dideoxygalactose transaminase n=1 Tax=Propionibacterium cyclohexanicum TaxID=64702 RepID=A0A1H9REP0_9ACTN|nr:hypothetical protein [Propionibacterium cyclohexanicum]SER71188.1 hypothetical protein SAMN05443377_10712 [Propionibacterium cyclohexanicum]